jgi:hypothetical protein
LWLLAYEVAHVVQQLHGFVDHEIKATVAVGCGYRIASASPHRLDHLARLLGETLFVKSTHSAIATS